MQHAGMLANANGQIEHHPFPCTMYLTHLTKYIGVRKLNIYLALIYIGSKFNHYFAVKSG